MTPPSVLIVGAGLAGLCCGRRLAQCGVSFQILEATETVGGRLRTEVVDGFRLDRSFPVFSSAFPEARRVLDYESLQLRPFGRGVLLWQRGRFRRIGEPLLGLGSLLGRPGRFPDRLRLVELAARWRTASGEEQDDHPDWPAEQWLRACGFSTEMIEGFFRPLLAATLLDSRLQTSSRLLRFLGHGLASGSAVVPAAGMQAIPDQLAERLPAGSLRLGARVVEVGRGEVRLAGGEGILTRAVVLATEAPEAARLTRGVVLDPGGRGRTLFYYAADQPPLREPMLLLDGDGTGPAAAVAVLSEVAPSLAPPDQTLMAVSITGIPAEEDAELDQQVRQQLAGWFGAVVRRWRLLRVYRVPHAMPEQDAGMLTPWRRPVRIEPGWYVCGDHRDNGTLDGAMASGFRAAQAVMEDLSARRC